MLQMLRDPFTCSLYDYCASICLHVFQKASGNQSGPQVILAVGLAEMCYMYQLVRVGQTNTIIYVARTTLSGFQSSRLSSFVLFSVSIVARSKERGISVFGVWYLCNQWQITSRALTQFTKAVTFSVRIDESS